MYRKEPIPSFLITIGLVDAVIGGLGDRMGLLSFGIVTIGSAIALRWWLQQKQLIKPAQPASQTYLPPAASSPVPTTSKRKRSSSR